VNVNFNFFAWIREGVRQSVLLGVSDAIETIGAPDNSNELHPQLQDLLRNDSGESGSNRAIEGGGAEEAIASDSAAASRILRSRSQPLPSDRTPRRDPIGEDQTSPRNARGPWAGRATHGRPLPE
jgi:hypothetical protein